MPTQETSLDGGIIQTTWTQPLNSDDLYLCFLNLARTIDDSRQPVHILFDITDAGSIPVDAPVLAIRSRFMSKANTGRIAVIGDTILPKMLADVAARVTQKEIRFFPDVQEALDYLHEPDH